MLIAAVLVTGAVAAAEPVGPISGQAIVELQCATCHDLKGPAATTLDQAKRRLAPDLFYAGKKFRRSWLVKWLQSPTPIRPAGAFYLGAVTRKSANDVIDDSKVQRCASRLTPQQAGAVADFLVTLDGDALVGNAFKAGRGGSPMRAYTIFSKQYACMACHRIRFRGRDLGGVSGPSLIDAGNRLRPEWIYSVIENPKRWVPVGPKPVYELSKKKLQDLTEFIAAMREAPSP